MHIINAGKMRRSFFSILLCLFTFGCYDVSRFQDDIADLQKRMTTLEQLCKDMNNNISALQTIVSASQNGNYITSVTPLIYDGEEVGYVISFVTGNPISIYHGKDGANGKDGLDGKDGNIPCIGVKMDGDNNWYWTIDDEWLLDTNGQKVKAVGSDGINGVDGKDGSNGITPHLKIEEGYWYVTVDNGGSWTNLGLATGDKGADGDSFFESVSEDDTNVYFTLTNGIVLKLQKTSDRSIKMALGSYIPALVSREVHIYYKSLFAVYDVSRYQVIVEGPIGIPYPRFWSFTPSPSDIGVDYDICFSLVDDYGDIIASRKTSIKCLPSPSFEDKNILVLGASNYATGTVAKEMCRQLTQMGGSPLGYGLSGINFIGRLTGSIETDIHQEATGGWSWSEVSVKNENNPFYNPHNKQIDFKYYSQQYCSGVPIDVLCVGYGWNSLTQNTSIIESVIKPFLRQFHMDYPDGVIVFGGLQPPSQDGGLGFNYGSSPVWNWLTAFRYVLDYNNEINIICQDAEFCRFVYYWPICELFDCENAYPTSVVSSNSRTGGAEEIERNGVHPTAEGRLQFADSGVLAICYALFQ